MYLIVSCPEPEAIYTYIQIVIVIMELLLVNQFLLCFPKLIEHRNTQNICLTI